MIFDTRSQAGAQELGISQSQFCEFLVSFFTKLPDRHFEFMYPSEKGCHIGNRKTLILNGTFASMLKQSLDSASKNVARAVTVFAALLLSSLSGQTSERSPGAEQPRLFVLVVFDQMRGDYLARWEANFSEGGFRRLMKDGAWFQNCHYPYAGTLTGAGHASLLSGCSPATHGIFANEWYDRATGTLKNCVSSVKYDQVPPLPAALSGSRGKVSPELLRAASFGDVLKEATAGKARIVGLSFKDRSAVLPAGRTPDACYWFDTSSGSFVTSTYYVEQLHPWVEQFNSERSADRWFGKEWTRFRADLDYNAIVGPDDVSGEGSGTRQGRTFPHPMTGGIAQPGPAFYQALYASPYGKCMVRWR